jgi:hypothetical protein
MKFRALWKIDQDKWLPVLKVWTGMTPQERANAGDGVKIIGRWHEMASRTGVLIVEANDIAAVQRYIGMWNPHMAVDLAPVVEDEEAAVIGKQIIEVNKA